MKYSVVIRLGNNPRYFPQVVTRLYELAGSLDFEVICMTCSHPPCLDTLKQHDNVRCFEVSPSGYMPGHVLNSAIRKAKGEFIVFLNDDAIPVPCENWLQRLCAPLEDFSIGAVFGRQIARKDAKLSVQVEYERAFGDGHIARKWGVFFSNVFVAIRRKTALQFPIDETIHYAEDIEWANRIKVAGLEIRYIPDIAVEHSHNYRLQELAYRSYREGYASVVIGSPASFWRTLLLRFPGGCFRDLREALRQHHLKNFPFAMLWRSTQSIAFAIGILAGRLGWFHGYRGGTGPRAQARG